MLAWTTSHGFTLCDPATGYRIEVESTEGEYTGTALCPMEVDGRPLLAVGGYGTLTFGYPSPAKALRVIDEERIGAVMALCRIDVDGHTMLASAGGDHAVRLWDLNTYAPGGGTDDTHPVETICVVDAKHRARLVTTASAGPTQAREPATGRVIYTFDRQLQLRALCSIDVAGRMLLAGIDARGVWLWDPRIAEPPFRISSGDLDSQTLCVVDRAGRPMLASIDNYRRLRFWDPESGRSLRAKALQRLFRRLTVRFNREEAMCTVDAGGRTLLASACGGTAGGDGGAVRLWDPTNGAQVRMLDGAKHVSALCAVQVAGKVLLATGSLDTTVRLWDPETGREERVLEGHTRTVRALCAFDYDGQVWLASGGADRSVRIWKPAFGTCYLTIPVHHEVLSCATLYNTLFIGLRTGVAAISLR